MRLCHAFPLIKFQIPNAPNYILAKPSFSFPFVKPPNMIPNVDEKVLGQELDLKAIPSPRPEAPWIKRCNFGIKFTDEIQEKLHRCRSVILKKKVQHVKTKMAKTNQKMNMNVRMTKMSLKWNLMMQKRRKTRILMSVTI